MEKNVKSRLEQVLEKCLDGREIAVWGNPTRQMQRALASYKFHIAGQVNPQKHYVVAVNDGDLSDFLADEQSRTFKYVIDYLTYEDEGGELPFERECFGAKIGRETYFGEGFTGACEDDYVESIGHFTSINSTARMGVNHQLNMVFTSDDIAGLLTNKNRALFENALKADKNHPYAHGCRITIGSDVYIGANAFINASKVAKIGDGAIIGAGAVVLEDVPPYAVVAGVPAKIKKYRFSPEMIEILIRVKWWDWPVDEINANFDALMSPELFMERFGITAKTEST